MAKWNFTLNGRPVTGKKFALPAIGVGLLVIAVFALFISFLVAYWENNVVWAVVGTVAMVSLSLYNHLKGDEKNERMTVGSFVRMLAAVAFLAGLWNHNWLLIILGIIFSIKLTFEPSYREKIVYKPYVPTKR